MFEAERHPVLTFLLWQAVGLAVLLCYVGLVALTGHVVLPLALAAVLCVALYRANPLAGFAVYLQFLLYQNIAISLVCPSLDADTFRMMQGTNFALTLAVAAVAAQRLWVLNRQSSQRGRKALIYAGAAGLVILAYTALGAAHSPGSAITYFRSTSVVLLGLLIGWDVGRQNSYRIVGVCFLTSLGLGLAMAICEVVDPVPYYDAINAPRYYLLSYSNGSVSARVELNTGQDLVRYLTSSFFNIAAGPLQTTRFGGPNMHSVSYAYVMSIGALVALSLGVPWFVLPILPLMVLIGVKGALILLVATTGLWVVGRLFGMLALAACGAVFTVGYLGFAIQYGLAAGDYHVLGFLAGLNGFLHNPIGHGIGAGGNLSSDFTTTDLARHWDLSQRYGADVPSESAIGVLLYQMGVGSAAVAYLIWTAFKSGFGRFSTLRGFIPLAVAVVTVNSVLQEEAFSPYSLGLLAMLAGVLSCEMLPQRSWVNPRGAPASTAVVAARQWAGRQV